MNWKILERPLGQYDISGGYAPEKKEWVDIAIMATLAAAGLATSIWGADASKKKAQKASKEIEREKSELENERVLKGKERWSDTASGQNTLRILRDQSQKFVKQQQGAAAVGGATDSSVALEKELQNQKQGEVIANSNADYDLRRDALDAGYRSEINRLNQQIISNDQTEAAADAQVASAVSNSLMQGAMAAYGGASKAPKATGGDAGGVGETGGSMAGGGVTPVQKPQSNVPSLTNMFRSPYGGSWNLTRLRNQHQNYNTLLGKSLSYPFN